MTDRIRVQVADQPIETSQIFMFAQDYGNGGQNFFFGSVRASNHGRNVTAVAYDAFVPLAERVLAQISREAMDRWGDDLKICVVHRTGKLGVGETSVGIGVSARHRDEAYQASRYIIEQIKLRAPIWKKEFYDTGETEWLKGHSLCSHSSSERSPPIDSGLVENRPF